MELDKIYKLDVAGNTRVWWAEIGEVDKKGLWRTHSGTLQGEITTSTWKYAEPKSQQTAFEQACFNANSEMNKKLKIDYRTSINSINELRNSGIRPMLAKEYAGWPGPCFAQPKLDGMRCIANISGLWSRDNNKIISTPHIEGALKAHFQHFPGVIFDGELYNHELNNFNSIMSMAKKTVPSFEDLERSKQYIQYWIYDIFVETDPNLKFEDRLSYIEDIFHPYVSGEIVLTPTRFVLTQDELDMYNIELLTQGYEGQIVRLNASYEQKRSYNLLKRKEFKDSEFELLDIQEGQGNWEGYAKIAICRLPNGDQFGAGISGTQDYCIQLLRDKNKYHSVTVKYQALTPDGIPRFPIAIKFYENMFDGMEERIKPSPDLFA
jgi:DNA ligase 1